LPNNFTGKCEEERLLAGTECKWKSDIKFYFLQALCGHVEWI